MNTEATSNGPVVGHDGPTPDLASPLLIGFGITSQAVAKALVDRGHMPTVIEDHPTDQHRQAADRLGLELVEAPARTRLADAVARASVLLPSPGVPDHHPVFALAATEGLTVSSEFDLAQRWDSRPVVAITGTNGKTTVTMMVADALTNSGRRAEPVGNTDVPFVESIGDPLVEVFVVEASSFRLAHSADFRPDVAAWLNFAPDHLDAHASLQDYENAKSSIWDNLRPGATIVANADDPVVMVRAEAAAARPGTDFQTFSISGALSGSISGSLSGAHSDSPARPADWAIDTSTGEPMLRGPNGPFLAISALTRRQPHDLANALATTAIAIAAGATIEGISETLRTFSGLAHRLEHLGRWDEIDWYNDSKATVPHATVAAVGGFESVVLIAGGRSKGLSFEPLRATVPPVKAVVAIGDAAAEMADTFADLAPVTSVTSMGEAVTAARSIAEAGDAVLLSPACASFDWYPNYVERGRDFSALVRSIVGGQDRPVPADQAAAADGAAADDKGGNR